MGFKRYEVHTPEDKQQLNTVYGLIESYDKTCSSFGFTVADFDLTLVRCGMNQISSWRDEAIARRDQEEILACDAMLEACRIKMKICEHIKEINHEG